jgi:hypothetical protein
MWGCCIFAYSIINGKSHALENNLQIPVSTISRIKNTLTIDRQGLQNV